MIESLTKAEPIISLHSVSKKFDFSHKGLNYSLGYSRDFWALRDISLNIGKGQVLGIIGRNGAGKTTLLNIIAGVLSSTYGNSTVKGKVVTLFNLGVGFQDELSGRDNIFLNGALLGATKEELKNNFDAIVAFSELGEFINMPLGTYSQGMRLRLGFSIVVNLSFDVLVIDEVLAVGDSLFQGKCFEKLMDLKRNGKTLVITSQGMDLIERLCDEAVLLNHGKILYRGEPVEGVKKYKELLCSERFFVVHPQEPSELVKDTCKWASNISHWGHKLGTRDAIIEKVKFINAFGLNCNRVKSGKGLTVKVVFRVRETIKEPHFGVAIFREDGVYCYGPNTSFDGHYFVRLDKGRGEFSLKYYNLLLAPGKYRLSVAIWDKNEVIPFEHHEGYYEFIVYGKHSSYSPLLKLQPQIKKSLVNAILSFFYKPSTPDIGVNYLLDCSNDGERKLATLPGIIKIIDKQGVKGSIFFTNEPVTIIVDLEENVLLPKNAYLWLGIYREDGVCCDNIIVKLKKARSFKTQFVSFPLLPGGYFISLGLWDADRKAFISCQHKAYPFRMVFSRPDHGTVYLKHRWDYSLSSKGSS